MVPRRTEWEVVYDNRFYTALSYLNKPISIWIAGCIISLNFYIGDEIGNPSMRLSLDLLHHEDREALADLERIVHREHRTPNTNIFKAVTRGGAEGRQTYHALYNARREYRAKDDMRPLDPTAFQPGDVVLAECWFVRKELRDGWQTVFHLTALSALASKPPPACSAKTETKFPWRI